jgi:hypothetical protein
VRQVVAHAVKHSSAPMAVVPQLQGLGTRMRHRLQPPRWALLLPPQARTNGRWLSASRQAAWGLHTLADLALKERAVSPEVSALAQALRGLKSCQLWRMTCVRQTPCGPQGMQMVPTHGWRAASMPAGQETRSD